MTINIYSAHAQRDRRQPHQGEPLNMMDNNIYRIGVALGLINADQDAYEIGEVNAIDVIDRCLQFKQSRASEFSTGTSPVMAAVTSFMNGALGEGAAMVDMSNEDPSYLMEKIRTLHKFSVIAVATYGSGAVLVFT